MGSVWGSFVHWFAQVIQFMYGLTVSLGIPNYGLAIILLTIVIKLVLFPLSQKQMKSMREMQELQPKLKYLQEKYKDDPQTMQMKVMELYKEHGVNPFSGCLPLLIQLPIFMAFYYALIRFKFTENASFIWIPNIANPDPYYILAVLAAVTTFLQQRVSMVDTKDPTQKSMLYVMPLFMAWVAATVPAGLPLYWVVFNILGILQQLYVNYGHKKAKLETGVGLQVEMSQEVNTVKKESVKPAPGQKVTGRDKGGKNHASPSNRKKRKKH